MVRTWNESEAARTSLMESENGTDQNSHTV